MAIFYFGINFVVDGRPSRRPNTSLDWLLVQSLVG
jgi:hypothetical protein